MNTAARRPMRPPTMSRPTSSGAVRPRNQDIEINGVYKNPKFTFGLSKIIGCEVELQVKNGKLYSGIFKTFSPDLEVVLECAHVVEPSCRDKLPSKDRIIEKLIVDFKDIVELRAVDADVDHGKTDSMMDYSIVKVNGVARDSEPRELTPWDDGGANETVLEDGASSGWTPEEMFKRNQEKFGVVTEFDNNLELYTTKLVESDAPDFQRKRAAADLVATQIESTSVSRRNTALENGDDSEEMRYSAVIRTPQHGGHQHGGHQHGGHQHGGHQHGGHQHGGPHHGGQQYGGPQHGGPHHGGRPTGIAKGGGNRYTPPQMRGDKPVQLSQSARLNNGETGTRDSIDRRSKVPVPTSNTEVLGKLKEFSVNFRIADAAQPPASAAEHKSPPKMDSRRSRPIEAVVSAAAAPVQSAAGVVSPKAAPPKEPVTEPVMTASKSETALALSPPGAQKSASDILSAEDDEPQPEAPPSSPTAVDPEAAVAKSTLNPEAKEFVFSVKTATSMPPPPPGPQAAAHQPAHPPPPPQPHFQHKSKTATVSVVEARPPTGRADMPTAAQAIGQPLINPTHPPPGGPYHNYVMVPQTQTRLQRVPSYNGNDVNQPTHFIQAQQYHQFVHGGMPGHVGMPQPVPGQHPQVSLPTAMPQHNAQLNSSQVSLQHQAPPATIVNNGGVPPSASVINSHMHHQTPLYTNHGAPVSYVYQVQQPPPPHVAPPTGPPHPPQPPPQVSPHNPSPSPGTMPNGGQYPTFPPPQSQQFYQGGHPVPPAGPTQYPGTPILYLHQPAHPVHGQHYQQIYHPYVQGYSQNFQPPQ